MEKEQVIYGTIETAIIEASDLAKASYQYINVDIQNIKKNFISLGFHLVECRDNQYYKDFGFDNFYDFVEKNFHMEKSAVSRHINIFMKFSQSSNNGVPYVMYLDDKYKKYSYSQLSEMLQLNDNQMKQIKPEMTIKEIRELKKSWKKKSEVATVATVTIEENICKYDSNRVCNIEEVVNKHFTVKGNIKGCAGCCCVCLSKEECNYCCGFVKESIESKIQQKNIERDNGVVAEVEYIEMQEGGDIEKEKQELPVLKNMEEREKFILDFKEWNIWCQNELTEETYYRFDLPDGAAIVIRSYPIYLEWKKEEKEGKELFLLKPGYKHFKNCESSMTEIKSYLKDLQKK